jgi:hypothetical protein
MEDKGKMTSQKWVVCPGNQPTDVPDPRRADTDDNTPSANMEIIVHEVHRVQEF